MKTLVLAPTVKLGSGFRTPVVAYAVSVIRRLSRFWATERERRALSRLTEHQLRDIGLSHADIALLKEPSPQNVREALQSLHYPARTAGYTTGGSSNPDFFPSA